MSVCLVMVNETLPMFGGMNFIETVCAFASFGLTGLTRQGIQLGLLLSRFVFTSSAP